MEVEDCMSSGGEDYYCSDRDSLDDALENEDSDSQWAPPKGSSSKFTLWVVTGEMYGDRSSVITKESLLAAQREDLRRVMELLSLREHHARTLLIHYRWDVEKIFAVLVEKGKIRLFTEAGWTEHFVVKINEGQSRRIRCMAHKCFAICDEAIIRNLVSKRHPDLAEKFDRFLLESYIEDNKMVKWCPSTPHCGNAIRVEEDEFCEVECSCGNQFCFSCLCEAHSPCSCAMWALWTKKCRDESETVNWITVHTKPCPNWLCGGATGRDHTWSNITGHSCGRYKEDREKKSERAKRDLYRYMHYHNRYKAHTDSFKQESRLKETIRDKVAVLESKDSQLRDFSWVTNGLYRLFRSRRSLSYSYPFAFYMFGDELFNDEMTKEDLEIKQHLFEDQQQQLETNVEKLSKFIEEPFDQYPDDRIMDIRMQTDLLGSLQFGIHNIAPYYSKGIEKATELT
ncbi:Zinc finger, C6HC-type, partial [Cynara cardunculus var. scolymus]